MLQNLVKTELIYSVVTIYFGLCPKLLTKSLRSPKKLPESPQEATKNFRAEILTNFVAILVKTITPKRHFEIN